MRGQYRQFPRLPQQRDQRLNPLPQRPGGLCIRLLLLSDAQLLKTSGITNESRYRTKTIPSAGSLLKEEDSAEKQQTFDV